MPADPHKQDESDDSEQRSFRALLAQAGRYSELAFIIPAGIIMGYLIGLGLDRWLHRSWLIIACVVAGVVAGFVQMIRRALELSK